MHMLNFDDNDTIDIDICDDAADTLRFDRLDFDGPTDPDATSIWDLGSERTHEEQSFRALDVANAAVTARYLGKSRRSAARRRLIRSTEQNIAKLRDAIAAGWDVGPELAYEEEQLAMLEVA